MVIIFFSFPETLDVGRTKRGSGGFGSTSLNDKKFFVIDESVSMAVNDKVIIDSVDNNIGKIIIDSDLSGSDNFEEVG